MSPTELTLRQLRAEGYTAKVVERWNHYAGIRQDLFGFDVLAARPKRVWTWDEGQGGGKVVDGDVLGVQACSDNGGSMAAHRTKLLANVDAAVWLASDKVRIEIWAWSTRRSEERTKAGKRSKRLVHHLRREEIRLSDFVPNQPAEQTRETMT